MTITDERLAELAAEAVEEAIHDLAGDRMGLSERLWDEMPEGITEEEQEAVLDRFEAAIRKHLPEETE